MSKILEIISFFWKLLKENYIEMAPKKVLI